MRKLIIFGIALLCCFFEPSICYAQAVSHHPLVKPMPGSKLIPGQSKKMNFSAHTYHVGKVNKPEKVEKKGKYWRLRYLIKDEQGRLNKNISRMEIAENYKAAALEKGGSVLYDINGKLTFTLPLNNGSTLWAYLSAGEGSYYLYIIEEAGFKQSLFFGADEMKRELDTKGSIALYGINFDTDSDKLKLGAEKLLIEMVKLMKNNPALKIEIQGHTDNLGSASHNLNLSNKRAMSVKNFLLLYGVSQSRLIPKGYGMEKPLGSNDTAEGRAKNRRVELVKLN